MGGWYANVESFHIYCSWEGGRELERVELERDRFSQLWENKMPNVRIFDIPEATKRRLLRYLPTQPDRNSHPSHQQQRPRPQPSRQIHAPCTPITD